MHTLTNPQAGRRFLRGVFFLGGGGGLFGSFFLGEEVFLGEGFLGGGGLFGRVFFGRRFVWEVFLGEVFFEEEVCLGEFFFGRRFVWEGFFGGGVF